MRSVSNVRKVGAKSRLLYIDDIPTPYRLAVHRCVAQEWPGQFKLVYCAASEPGRDWLFDFSGLDVEILNGWSYRPKRQVNPLSIKWNPMVATTLSQFDPDVVAISGYLHPTMMLAASWCRKHKVPYGIVCETSCRNSNCYGWRWYIKRLVVGKMVRAMSFGLPVGREAADYLRLLGASDAPMHYFPNTPDVSFFATQAKQIAGSSRETEVRQRLGLPAAGKIVLFVGRLIPAKRPLDVVDAFRRVANDAHSAILVIAGDGPLMPDLLAATRNDQQIFFTGWLRDQSELASLMAIASMMVLPSEHEPWGAVVNEAMAAGLPVIASDQVGAAVELIEQGINGFLYPAKDTTELSRIMGQLLAHDVKCRQIGDAAQETVLKMDHAFAASNLISAALAAVRPRIMLS